MPVRFNIHKTPPALIHCIAECADCEWRNESYRHAQKLARNHVKKTGHTVKVDQGFVYELEGR